MGTQSNYYEATNRMSISYYTTVLFAFTGNLLIPPSGLSGKTLALNSNEDRPLSTRPRLPDVLLILTLLSPVTFIFGDHAMRESFLAAGIPPALAPPARWTEDDRLDAKLMALVRDRDDHAAFGELRRRIAQAIDGPLIRYLPAAEIDDGRSEVQLRIWSRRNQYREDRGTVRVWVRSTSRFYAWDWLRKNSKAPRLLGNLYTLDIADQHPDPAASIEQADWDAHVGRVCSDLLASFPPHVRTCFELRMQGIGYATIASTVGCPVGTVASAVHRVREKLLALVETNYHPLPTIGENMDLRIESMQDEMQQIKAKLSAIESSLIANVGAIKDQLDQVEQQVKQLTDTPSSRAKQVWDRVSQLIDNPVQHQSDTDWAEVEDLVENRLRPVMKNLPKGLMTKVSSPLKESRKLLKKVPGHAAAIYELRRVQRLLEDVITGGHDGVCR